MDGSLTEISAAAVLVGGSLGTFGKFWLDRISQRQKDAEAAQNTRQKALEEKQERERLTFEAERIKHELRVETERNRWEAVMKDNIDELRKEISGQEREINYLRRVSDAYLRHISVLEGLMRGAGMQVPSLVLPSHPRLEIEQ